MEDKPNENHPADKDWKVINQKKGRIKPTTKSKNIGVKANDELEREADELGKAANQKKAP
ncbi:hypothetical protein [Pedobacter foliorum]|uniref:hypothetical protein n=1 Tax=Pedobacter foliorum TaxID=2739058 RepID=UPI0015630BB4|nr:hypothetical protein [Pedobacter foliorum]NRF40670.1 hypothetical protein [Pedobacter foliorum]